MQAKKNVLMIENFLFFDHFKRISVFKAMMPALKESTMKNKLVNPKVGYQFNDIVFIGHQQINKVRACLTINLKWYCNSMESIVGTS